MKMESFLYKYFNKKTINRDDCLIFYFNITWYDQPANQLIFVKVDKFIEMFEIPIQKAINNDTHPMDEIRLFDPDNKIGYNELLNADLEMFSDIN